MLQESIKINSQLFKIKSNSIITKDLSVNQIFTILSHIGSYDIIRVANYLTLENLLTNNPIEIHRIADSVNLNKIIIPNNYVFNDIESLQIIFGGDIIFDIPFAYLLHFSKIKTSTNNIIITINDDLIIQNQYINKSETSKKSTVDTLSTTINPTIIEGIPIGALQYYKVEFNLKSCKEITYSMILKYSYYGSELSETITESNFITKINDLNTCITNELSYDYRIYKNVPVNCIFIYFKCAYIKEPRSLQIILNDTFVLDWHNENY
jgi:hypothetical protein